MHLTWHGQYTVKMQTGDSVVVLDPGGPDQGISSFKGKATLVGLTNPADPGMSHVSGAQGDPLVVNTPGEYSFDGISLQAFSWQAEDGSERSMHRWRIEGMSLLHLGARPSPLTERELQDVQQLPIDILLLPIGGGSGLTLKDAMTLLTTIEPRVVIPIHYKLPKLTEKLESVEAFAQEIGLETAAAVDKLTLKANKLPEEEMEAVILKA